MICGQKRMGGFQLQRRTRRDRMQTTIQRVKGELQRRRHQPIPEQGKWLGQVVRGFFAYHAVRRTIGAWWCSESVLLNFGSVR